MTRLLCTYLRSLIWSQNPTITAIPPAEALTTVFCTHLLHWQLRASPKTPFLGIASLPCILRTSILVSYGCCNKTPKVAGLKQVYSLMVLEARNAEWFSLGWNQGISMNVHLPKNLEGHPLPCLFQSPVAAWTPWLVAPSSISRAQTPVTASLIIPPALLTLALSACWLYQVYINNPGEPPHRKIFSLITTTKSLLPTKVIFTGFRD